MASDESSGATEFKPSGVTELTQELRLATTITGGVSLAIWMAGVVRELNLLAQASEWRRSGKEFPPQGTLTAEAAAALGLYRDLIELLDLVVDVDLMSGTSAGGIGAALLAWSRVRGSDLGKLRDIWLNLGALTKLLRNPTDKNVPSLLYGDESMFEQLTIEIPKLADGPFLPESKALPPTTLFVTTTLLTGETSRFTDAYGTLVQDVDRRGIFTFTEQDLAKPEPGVADKTPNALALAARSSASFPLAFEPSFIPFRQGTTKKGGVPERPPMYKYANVTRPHWAADGGLLDNQPIDVLLPRIFDRPAEREVRRVLLYVVPSVGPAPDMAEEAPQDNVDEPLGLVDGLLKDLSAATTQSIAADLRTIRAHQDRMEARTDAKLRLAELGVMLKTSRLLTTELLADYRTREATKQAQALTSALLRQLSTWPPAQGNSVESVPQGWEEELKIGGVAESICRETIKLQILESWPKFPLPVRPDQLREYGQPALDLAKACSLAIVQAAYQLAVAQRAYRPEKSTVDVNEDLTALATLTDAVHKACMPKPRPDLGELVHEVCTEQGVRRGALVEAAKTLLLRYRIKTAVQGDPWQALGQAINVCREKLRRLVADAVSATRAEDQAAAGRLETYLKYLEPLDESANIARKMFDLAVTQRAMLPAEADIEQSLALVQVSADTRSLLATDWQTAQKKLTGMQFHHFGAFYKRSWRANDWMWGRLDGAGWLVHVLLDPRRIRSIVHRHADDLDNTQENAGALWFIDKVKDLGKLDLPNSDGTVTEQVLCTELAFLDDPSIEIPPSLPTIAMWLAQPWQKRILDEELEELANTVVAEPQSPTKPDWSPPNSRSWARRVQDAKRAVDDTKLAAKDAARAAAEAATAVTTAKAAKAKKAAEDAAGKAKKLEEDAAKEAKLRADNYYALLNTNAVAEETLASDKGSPLMANTITKAAATASAAVGSVRQIPAVLRPPLVTVRTLALGGYRVVSSTKGVARWTIITGTIILILGIAAAVQPSAEIAGFGLIAAGIGGYAIVLGTWQCSGRTLFAILAFGVVFAIVTITTSPTRERFWGTDKDHPGFVGSHIYWIGQDWRHPLAVIGALVLAVILMSATNPRGKWGRVLKPSKWPAMLRHAMKDDSQKK
jgi:patatin-related protein